MIHIPFFIPLLAGGLIGALWREHRQVSVTPFLNAISLPEPLSANDKARIVNPPSETVFDDMEELHHYQRVSWYALAFSASGSWFYPPATLLGIPLLSYNAYNFIKTLRQTEPASRASPMTVFELFGVTGSLVSGRPLMASLMFLFVFGSRHLLIQTKNLAHIDFSHVMDPHFAKVWILHEGAEIEVTLNELQAGDIVVIHGGDLVLIEGIVVNGQGSMRQYSLQKAMKSVPKRAGSRVFPFTQLESGHLHIRKI